MNNILKGIWQLLIIVTCIVGVNCKGTIETAATEEKASKNNSSNTVDENTIEVLGTNKEDADLQQSKLKANNNYETDDFIKSIENDTIESSSQRVQYLYYKATDLPDFIYDLFPKVFFFYQEVKSLHSKKNLILRYENTNFGLSRDLNILYAQMDHRNGVFIKERMQIIIYDYFAPKNYTGWEIEKVTKVEKEFDDTDLIFNYKCSIKAGLEKEFYFVYKDDKIMAWKYIRDGFEKRTVHIRK